MMKFLKILLIAIAALLVALVAVYAYYGGFKTIVVAESVQGGETIVYEKMTGDYSQTPAVQDKIYNALFNDYKIRTTRGFGIYYDDPKEVEAGKLRSEVGCIVEALDSLTLANIAEKYEVRTLPVSDCVVAEFPYKGMMSVMVGIMKVYPAIEKYCHENQIGKGPIMEIYDIPNKKIIYRKEKI